MSSLPTVSVVICTRFRPADLENCLSAITALEKQPDELIIIDNTAGDIRTQELAQAFSAKYFVEAKPGLSRARNRGLVEATSDIVAYLDDDALPEKDWLGQLLEPFSDPQVAVATGIVVTPTMHNGLGETSRSLRIDNHHPEWFEIAAFGGLGSGGNMALRKSACTSELFDVRLGRGAPYRGMEEHFAFVQLLSRDRAAMHVSSAAVHHLPRNAMLVPRDARNAFAYILLLLSEFPKNRRDLFRFLLRRFQHKPLSWKRNAPDPGVLVKSNYWVLFKAGITGTLLFLRNRKPAEHAR